MKPNYLIIPLVVLLVAVAGSYFTGTGMAWYKTINLPTWAPNGAFIGTVWTIIFILSAIATILVWNGSRGPAFKWIIGLLILNGLLNIFWCFLFFNLHLFGWSIVEMIILEATVIAPIILIWPSSQPAALLFLPYAVWVPFATYLAISVWRLN